MNRKEWPDMQVETRACGQGALLCGLTCTGENGHYPENGGKAKPRAGEKTTRIRAMLFHVLRLLLGGVWLYASYDKILHPSAFAQAVYNHQVLPDGAVNLVALTLPWMELLLGLCLVAGIWLPGATAISTGLLTVFIGVLVFNQIRGLDVHCGCFSTETTEGPADLLTVARDVGFWAASVYLTVRVFFDRLHAGKPTQG